MKKIINGKLYNTETAHLVGTWSNEMDGDFSWTEESLYQKKTGEFFIYGQGGAHTRYAQNTDATHWGEGEAITLISYDDARQWAEEHLTADQYQEAFGEVTEDSNHLTNTGYITPAVDFKHIQEVLVIKELKQTKGE